MRPGKLRSKRSKHPAGRRGDFYVTEFSPRILGYRLRIFTLLPYHDSMKRVLASGVFDVIHPGHLHYFEEAKRLGDRLIVVVTSDAHATKSKRPPRHAAAERLRLVQALQVVDEAFIGAKPYDLLATARLARPDIIALGYDQTFEPAALQSDLAAGGLTVEIIRLANFPASLSTTAYLDL